jgi:putative OPT family oligopeptide transporter
MTTSSRSTAELTLRAVLLGLVLSAVMGAANVYLGLKAGMTVSASIPAAVIAMVLLRAFGGTILECNQVQTAASAGESLAAGIIFTMPALVLIGVWQQFDMLLTTVIAFTGGLLGILFMIPMRRVFVTGARSELKYPEGLACAAVLRAGDAGAEDGSAMAIMKGALLGSLIKLMVSFAGVIRGALEGATYVGSRVFYVGGDVSPALVAVGYIVGLNVSLLIFIGGALAWLVGIPLLGGGGQGEAVDAAWTLWSTQIRYVGVGCMVVGGVASIWRVRGGLVQAVSHLKAAATTSQTADELDRDLPGGAVSALAVVAVVLVGAVYYHLTGDPTITLITTIIMVVMSFFFTAVASYIVGLVGNSNSPVSGMTITTVLFTGLLLIVFGYTGTEGMVATLGVAAIVCCAACTSGDVCNDLRTGFLVGAQPRRQQIMQILGVAVACLVMAPVLQLLHDYTPGGIGGRELPAPQAALFASLARGFFGEGQLPWNLVAVGAVLGAIFLVIDKWLEVRGSTFRAHLMPIAVGMYLPFGLAIPILIGGLIHHMITRGHDEAAAERRGRHGVLFASGSIAGESLMGVGLAGLASVGLQRLDLGLSEGLVTALTLVAAAALVACFIWAARAGTRE